MTVRAFIGEKLADLRARSVLPVSRRHDDLYLVEFPKSGVTWFSYLMANTELTHSGLARRVTFFNLNEFVPDIHFDRQLAPPRANGFGFRCIKSHAGFTPQYKRVFYLVRDPRAVMASYFGFTSGLGHWKGSLEEFVRHPEFGIGAWIAHVDGWLDGIDEGLPFALVRYEDLLTDTAGTLRILYKLLGLDLYDAAIAAIVARSSIECMREDEALFNAGHRHLKDFSFVRRDKTGGPRVPLPDAVKAHIEAQAGPTMRRLGYEI